MNIPVIANGDIYDIDDAQFIFDYTNADGLMLGRISHGQPWIFKEISSGLSSVASMKYDTYQIELNEKINTTLEHINAIHRYYGTDQGVRIARKHIGWYLYNLVGQDNILIKKLKKKIFILSDAKDQLEVLNAILTKELHV